MGTKPANQCSSNQNIHGQPSLSWVLLGVHGNHTNGRFFVLNLLSLKGSILCLVTGFDLITAASPLITLLHDFYDFTTSYVKSVLHVFILLDTYIYIYTYIYTYIYIYTCPILYPQYIASTSPAHPPCHRQEQRRRCESLARPKAQPRRRWGLSFIGTQSIGFYREFIAGVGNCPILGILDITWKSSHYRPYT